MPEIAEQIDRLRTQAATVPLEHLTLIELTGRDRLSWLQGQVTQDLRRLEVGGTLDYCQCSPTGQLEAIVRIWAQEERFLLATDRVCAPAVLERARAMVIMEDVVARELDGILVAVQGPHAGQFATGRGCLESDRTGSGGWEVFVPVGSSLKTQELPPRIEEGTFEVLEIEAGIPRFGLDADLRTLPPELGAAFERRTISYEKGCYTGQEVLMRIHSRGHTNRTWVGLIADEPLVAGASVSHGTRAEAGRVTRTAQSPEFGPIAAAMVRNEVANPGEHVLVQTPKGLIQAEVQEMPLRRPNP